MSKIILDLCGGTGAWSKPYKDAGYDVKVITLPEHDIAHYYLAESGVWLWGDIRVPLKDVYGVLAAPPCTMFSYARTKAVKPRDLREGIDCVRTCLDIIWTLNEVEQDTGKKTLPLKFWALENPAHGFLQQFLGKPAFTFDPWEFGDQYKKKTALWGYFNDPKKTHTEISAVLTAEQIEKHKTNSQKLPKFDRLKSGELDRQAQRAITPTGFAQAFFKANQ